MTLFYHGRYTCFKKGKTNKRLEQPGSAQQENESMPKRGKKGFFNNALLLLLFRVQSNVSIRHPLTRYKTLCWIDLSFISLISFFYADRG